MLPGRFIKTTRRVTGRSTLVVIVIVSAFAALGITLAVGATGIPAPTITSKPANPTNQTSAHFTYTDSTSGVTFQCELDGAGFSACPSSGITYSGLASKAHTFRVKALSGGKASPVTSYTWTIDTSPPTLEVNFPVNKHTYHEGNWNSGCPGGPGVCGSARDPSGVGSVVVSIRQGSGNWWGGGSFNQTGEYFNVATVVSPGATSTEWRVPLPFPPTTGSYTVHVRATDSLGNTTPAGSQLATTFNIDVTPETPTITSGPGEHTESTTAKFAFTDSESGVTFLCRLDGGSFSACKSPITYTGLAVGAHTFYVEAKDGKGNLSVPASYSWTIGKKLVEEQPFTISGNVAGPLAPGVSQSLPLTISNPNGVPIKVTSLLATPHAGSTKAGCDGPTNTQVTQSNASEANTLTVPANGQVTLPSGTVSAPQVLMKDLAVNQDACKGASFTFNYSGSAHS
jgi:hypothetical protein